MCNKNNSHIQISFHTHTHVSHSHFSYSLSPSVVSAVVEWMREYWACDWEGRTGMCDRLELLANVAEVGMDIWEEDLLHFVYFDFFFLLILQMSTFNIIHL